jgi:hypothetical protein
MDETKRNASLLAATMSRLLKSIAFISLASNEVYGFVPNQQPSLKTRFEIERPLPALVSSHQGGRCCRHGQATTTSLFAKLWDRLKIEEDEEPMWYLLNCVAGLEIHLLRQCRAACDGMEDAEKFVVPTEIKTRSHGANRMVTETKVKWVGYVFAKLRLCSETYEAIQGVYVFCSEYLQFIF